MSKTKALLAVIEDVRSLADSLIPLVQRLNSLVENLQVLSDLFSESDEETSVKLKKSPTTKQSTNNDIIEDTNSDSISYDELSNTLMGISRISKAHSEKLRAVVRKYGATKLSDISPENYKAILIEAEEIRNAE